MQYNREIFESAIPEWRTGAAATSTRFQICHYPEPHHYTCTPLPMARFVYICEGSVVFSQFGERSIACKQHDVIYIPTGVTYESHWAANSSFYVVDVWHMLLFQTGMELESRIRVLHEDKTNTLGKAVDQLLEQHGKNNPFYWMDCASIVTKFMCDAARVKDESDLQSAGIYESVLYLRTHYDQEITTADLAARSSFSESQFRRLFKKHMGTSPTEYRNILRVKKADEWMRVYGLSAAQAAVKVGFSDVNYFYRLSKKYIGGWVTRWAKFCLERTKRWGLTHLCHRCIMSSTSE